MAKHTQNLHTLDQQFQPFDDPFTNIYNIDDLKLKKYTYQIFHDEWQSKLEASTKGETYKSFKTSMKCEPYLHQLSRRKRVLLTKLRVSDHKLMIK